MYQITQGQVDNYELLSTMFNAIFTEMKEFSKKKQDETLNKLKVTLINNILSKIQNEILSSEPSTPFLKLLDDETLPTYSDSVLILAQFRASMDQFKDKYQKREGYGSKVWSIKNKK